MSVIFHLDYETFSKANIRDLGAYRYASDPSTEILMLSVAREDEKPLLYVPEQFATDTTFTDHGAEDLLSQLADGDCVVYAHNASFEIAITHHLWTKFIGKKFRAPRLLQWRCTKAMAYRAGLGGHLEDIAKRLKLAEQKDNRGKALIQKFSIPNPRTGVRTMPQDDPAAFREFGDYCLQDTVTERAVAHALARFADERHDLSRRAFAVHNRINLHGIPVNRKALRNAYSIVKQAESEIVGKFRAIVGLNPTQREKVLDWLQIVGGYPFQDLQADTIEHAIDTAPRWCQDPSVLEALKLRRDQSYAATKKIATMLALVEPDGFVRGTLDYHGAQRTGRSAGRLIQPQNFRRPTIKDTAGAYRMICEGCTKEELEMMYGSPIEVLASCIRHFLQPHEGYFYSADYSSIEARIVAWLAGQEDAVREFAKNIDRYVRMASKIFSLPEQSIGKDSMERFVGKQTILGCGFQMSGSKFRMTCANYGQDISNDLAELAVATFREQNPMIVKLWGKCEKAAISAIRQPGAWFPAGDKIKYGCMVDKRNGITFLHAKLPSGRLLSYPHASLTMVKKFGQVRPEIRFWTPEGPSSTYGGKLVENVTQATAADFMMHGAWTAQERGFNIVTLVHDEAIAMSHDELTIEDYTRALCDLPSWGAGMPLASEGKIVPYYTK